MKKKPVALLLSGALLLGCTVGGTLAWLTDESEAVSNTFTVGDVQIALEETTGNEYKMTPGVTLPKDPTVTVKAGSEDCYVFVKVEKSSDFDKYITYQIDTNNWAQLTGVDDVYCTTAAVRDVTTDRSIKILLDEQVQIKDSVTKEMMQSITDANKPTLTFTAYAIQLKNTNDTEWDAAAAWEAITNQLPPNN
ncbi:MAG: hypothetical protein IJB55_06435 [Firmicutes bacterium]|nr:hypothetical protein [Bacillota bacterium]